MKSIFSNKKVTMIISLCFAFALWFYVSIVLNPEIEIKIDKVPVVYSDMQTLTDRGLTVVNDKPGEIEVKLRGNRRALNQVNEKNISAVVDLKEYAKVGEYDIPISVKIPADGVAIVSRSQRNMKVTVEYIATATVDIVAKVKGTPKDKHIAINELASEKRAVIRGPQSVIKTVTEAQAIIEVDGATKSISTLAQLVLVDSSGNEINNGMVKITPDKVEATCTVGYAKTVNVTVPVKNNTKKNVVAIPAENGVVTLVGPKAEVEKIDEIETESIDAKNYYYDYELTLDLKLPEGVVTQSGKTSVKVKVDVVEP